MVIGRMTSIRVAAASLLLLAGCHTLLPGGVPCSAHGGPEWRAYRSKHFVVLTDLDRPAATALVADLEHIQGLVSVALVREQRDIPGYVRVIVPAQRETFWRIAPPRALAYYTVTNLGEATVVLDPEALRQDPEVVAHELAHHWTWYFFPRQPLWFTEGIAQFVQTVATDAPGYHNVVGVVPRIRAGSLSLAKQVPSRALLTTGGEEYDMGSFELWSWVLYHWLWTERPKQLAEFQRRLGSAEDPLRAWIAAFPEFDPRDAAALRKLDVALDDHTRNGDLVYYPVTAKFDAAFTDGPLSPADVHEMLADTKQQLEAALEDDPRHPVALLRTTKVEDVASMRASTAAHPADWRAWYLLGRRMSRAHADPSEVEAAFRRAVELDPSAAYPQNELAWALVTHGRPAEAFPFARRAVDLAPADAHILDTLARVAGDIGACREARQLQERAVALAPGRELEELQAHLRDLEKGCVPK